MTMAPSKGSAAWGNCTDPPAREVANRRYAERGEGLLEIFQHGRSRHHQSRPTTRSSRWTISARPEKPRIVSISLEDRPRIFCASSAS